MSGNMLSNAVHRALYGVALVSAAGLPAVSQAQEEDVLEEIITTGSRIPVDANLVSSSPITTLDSEELTYSGVTRVEDLVNDLPQIVPEFTSTDSNGSQGTATLDLRGLGSNRTLVLMNGHRLGFGDPQYLAPDINQIPGNLIERVEVLTGGASSTYGSDAVSGVVNFIMKDNYEGFNIDYQVSGYRHDNDAGDAQDAIAARNFEQAPGTPTDGNTTDITLTVGVNSADGRGNVTGYIGWRNIKEIRHSERDYAACALSGGGAPGSNDIGSCGGSSTTPTGSFRDFSAIDLTLDLDTGDFVPRAGDVYNYGPPNFFQRPDERWTGGLFANYEVGEGIEAYAEFTFMDDRSLAQIAPSGTFFNNTGLNCDNPLMSAQQLNAIGCVNPTDFVPIYVGKRNVEGGSRASDLQHNSNRALVGIRGEITDNWSFDGFINFARLNYNNVYQNDLSITNIIRSLDVITDPATGQPACRSFVDGTDSRCVPYNVFQPGGVTQAAINYIDLPLYSKANLDMSQGVFYVTGDLTDYGVKLPTADDGITVVVGAEYRDDTFNWDLDQGYNNGNAAGQGGATPDVNGAVLVKEYFTEMRIPLVQGRKYAEELALDLRYRYSDYDIDIDADTYNVGLSYAPTEDFKFRGSKSRAVRAPDIAELFAPQSIGLWQGTDPCAGPTPSLTEAQCARTGVPAGTYGFVAPSPADQYNGLFGGNPQLDAETSDSFTVGMVLTPVDFIEGLSVSVDYWSIEVDDAIDTIDPEFTINQCALGNDALCGLIQRNPVNGNVWVGSGPNAPRVQATNINIGKFEVTGWDISATYAVEIGNHSLDFAMRGSLLDKWDEEPIPGEGINDCAGYWGGVCGRPRPEWKHTFSTTWGTPVDGLTVVGNWRYVGEVDEFAQFDDAGNITSGDRYSADGQNYLDLSASYFFEFGGDEVQITAGITNILDEEPPYAGVFNTAPYSNANTIPGTWDALGQYWFLGLTYSR